MIWVLAKGLFSKSCQLDYEFQAGTRTFLDIVVNSWSMIFTTRITEPGETTQYHRWRLETSCCFIVDWTCRKWDWKRNFGLLYQPKGARYNHVMNGFTLVFSSSSLVAADFDWQRVTSGRFVFLLVSTNLLWLTRMFHDIQTISSKRGSKICTATVSRSFHHLLSMQGH